MLDWLRCILTSQQYERRWATSYQDEDRLLADGWESEYWDADGRCRFRKLRPGKAVA